MNGTKPACDLSELGEMILTRILQEWEDEAMSTRCQIGIYETAALKDGPIALIYRESNGYPTGSGAVMPDLVQFVSEVIEKRTRYEGEHLAAQLVYRFIESHDGGTTGTGYGLSADLHGDIRFYYAVTPEGVSVYDAREIKSLARLPKPMFTTAWIEPERVRAVEKELAVLAEQVAAKQVELRGLKAKQYTR